MSKIVLGFCGPEGAGKSTAAKLVCTSHRSVQIIPFAQPLKKMLEALGVPAENLYGTLEQKLAPLDILAGHSARWAAQSLGTEWGRDLIHPDLWVLAWKRAVAASEANIVLADDLRFQNEAAAVQTLGGKIVLLMRPDADDRAGTNGAHRSQEYWKLPVDETIINSGDLGALDRALLNVVGGTKENVAA